MRKLWIVIAALCLIGIVVGGVVLSLGQWTPQDASSNSAVFRDDAAEERSQCTSLMAGLSALNPVDPEVAEQTHQAMIASPEVAQSIALLEHAGTPVIVWGEVLTTEQIYVQPICLKRYEEDTEMILVRVIVADGDLFCQGTNLAEALDECATATG